MSSFGMAERRRQAAFRNASPTISARGRTPEDEQGRKHGHLLTLGCEEENLDPVLRGEKGGLRFFKERGLKWWQARVNGDNSEGVRPTRNLASSQIACVNFLLPLAAIPGALMAVLRAIDHDVTGIVDIHDGDRASKVEIEWIGLGHALEGPTVKSRGAHSTSVDAFVVADTPAGRRAYLLEWKHVEDYPRGRYQGAGRPGDTRRRRYANLYAKSTAFNGKVPLDAWFFDPFYQIMRLLLLADRMVANRELGVSEAKVVVVVPAGNKTYRERITSPVLFHQFPEARTVADVVREALTQPDNAYASVCPSTLAEAVREQCGRSSSAWGEYQHARYGW